MTIVLLLLVQATASQASELALEVGDKFKFTITDLVSQLEINGTDYADIDTSTPADTGFVDIKEGDTFNIQGCAKLLNNFFWSVLKDLTFHVRQ